MAHLLWIVGELVVGFSLSGIVAAVAVPALVRAGWNAGPWLLWVIVAATVLACIVLGERIWKRRRGPRAA